MGFFRAGVGVLFVALALSVWAGGAGAAVPGELDPSFGYNGRVEVLFGLGSEISGVAAQPDGRIVVAGSTEYNAGFSIARLLPNGALDPTWGNGGVATTLFGEFAGAYDVAIQPDGKVVAVGLAPGAKHEDFAVVRYLSNGKLDPGFGKGGVVNLPVGTISDNASAVAIGPGGRIAVTGTSTVADLEYGAGVAVLESDGTPEAAFAGDGTTVIETGSGSDRGEGIAVQKDGKVVVADATAGDGFTIVRLGLDGKPDPSFGGDGIVKTPIPGKGKVTSSRTSDVLIQPDGKIVVGGYSVDHVSEPPGYITNFTLARYTEDGELDQSFGSGGIASAPLPGDYGGGHALGLAANGKLILGGSYDPSSNPHELKYASALARFNPNGSLDGSFGAGGIVRVPLGAGVEDETLEGLAIQPDGKIVTTGDQSFTGPCGPYYLNMVSRYIADLEAPPHADVPPHSKIKGVHHKIHQGALRGFHGTASDPDGSVRKVQVGLVRLPSCGKAALSIALKPRRWRAAKGTSKWALKLKHPLAPGRYLVFSRAVDAQGLKETRFSHRLRNSFSFRVLPGSG